METRKLPDLQTLVSLCKRRGFVFQSSEIYGGLNSCWDYGPLGVQLKRNIKELWWETMTTRRDVVGLDASILMHPKVWEASGHTDNFSDPMVDCRSCKSRFRADQLETPQCPSCGSNELTDPREFNLMFKTHMGPVEEAGNQVYLRPETAQGIFVNFDNVRTSMRLKIPFGIAQIGKSFRNEITPGNFVFRTREFEQMEMQYFVAPEEDDAFFEKWKQWRFDFYKIVGIAEESLRFHDHGEGDLAHYAKQAGDIEFMFPMGWQELEGVHNRTDFDLGRHQSMSSKKLEYFDEVKKRKFLPYVIETAVGCDRLFLAMLCDAYREEITDRDGKEDVRVVLGLNPKLAPVQLAVLPLSKKPPLQELGEKLQNDLRQRGWRVQYDESQSIGKRYRRQDEIGTPFCLTVDFDSLEDQAITLRERDTMTQERVALDKVASFLDGKL